MNNSEVGPLGPKINRIETVETGPSIGTSGAAIETFLAAAFSLSQHNFAAANN